MKMVSLIPLLPPVQFLTNLLAWYNSLENMRR